GAGRDAVDLIHHVTQPDSEPATVENCVVAIDILDLAQLSLPAQLDQRAGTAVPQARVGRAVVDGGRLGHANSLSCRRALSIRSHAMSKYLGSRSMPMKVRPRFMQATPVVPLPMNGSQTVSPWSVN